MADLRKFNSPFAPAWEMQDRFFARAFDVLREGIAKHAFPGAATAVLLNGKLVAWKAEGRYTYDDASAEVRADCIWDLASVSKVVATTATAMILYERGELGLDQKIASFFPQASADVGQLTLRHLLTHSSGLPGYVKFFEQLRGKQEIAQAALQLMLEAKPGTRAEYSDPGFILLGAALEKIAGATLDRFCRDEVFAPLQMCETAYNPPAEWWDRIPPAEDDQVFRHKVMQGEVDDENTWAMGGVAGHAGVFASALDVAKFAQCMLNGGAPILKPETVRLFSERQELPPGSSRALGWDTPSKPSQSGRYFSGQAFGHLGFTGTSVWIDPAPRLAIVLLTNRTWPDRSCQLIKQVRPAFHDAVIECLGLEKE